MARRSHSVSLRSAAPLRLVLIAGAVWGSAALAGPGPSPPPPSTVAGALSLAPAPSAATAPGVLPPPPGDSSAPASRPLVIGVKAAPPFVMRGEDEGWDGLAFRLWQEMAAATGLECRYVERDLEGLFAGVASESLDVGLGAVTVTPEREVRFDFTHPFYSTGLGIAVPRGKGAGWTAVARRFLSLDFVKVVGSLLLLLLASGVLVWIFERRANPEQFGGSSASGIASGFWWAAVTMTTVGYGDKAPRTAAGRVVGLVWMFVAVIVISSFTAAIASSLTVSNLESRVRGPEDLAEVQVGSVAGTTSGAYLERRGIVFRPYATPQDAVEGLRRGEVEAVVYDAPVLRYLARATPGAGVRVLDRTFEPQQYAFVLPQGSRLREALNRALLAAVRGRAWQEEKKRLLGR